MKISARNAFKGTISAISNGPVSTEVTITIAPKIEMFGDHDEIGETTQVKRRFEGLRHHQGRQRRSWGRLT